MKKDKILCPSSPCKEGAIILGIVQGDQKVALLNVSLMVDEAFLKTATEVGRPEQRLRFAHHCVEGACSQWTGKKCGVIEEMVDYNPQLNESEYPLPNCQIRNNCRWFKQEGPVSCVICPYVVTDNFD